MSNDVACFNFDVLVCPIVVEAERDIYPGGYKSLPVIEAYPPRSDISSPDGSRARDDPPISEASSSSADS